MPWETVYSGLNGLAIIGWLALAFAPFSRNTLLWTARGIALLLALAYLYMLFFTTVSVKGGGFGTLAAVQALFTMPPNVMLGWTHYLAFDLFIGSWEVEDSGRRGVPHWLVLPCLVATLMVGPVGLLLYFVARTFARRRQA
jgi:hypothetical protein